MDTFNYLHITQPSGQRADHLASPWHNMVLCALAALLSPVAAVPAAGDLLQYTQDVSRVWLDNARSYIAEETPVSPPATDQDPMVGYFLRTQPDLANGGSSTQLPSWLDGHSIFRSVPSKWPKSMNYHYGAAPTDQTRRKPLPSGHHGLVPHIVAYYSP